MLYLHTTDYLPQAEAGVNALDPRLDIHWPLPVIDWSVRDQAQPFLDDEYSGIDLFNPITVRIGSATS
jgi:dTDP-4-dehydrorhamnose 3,5-epimerase